MSPRPRPMQANNTSGIVGVYFHKGRWSAKIGRLHIGTYASKEDAAEARRLAESCDYTQCPTCGGQVLKRALKAPPTTTTKGLFVTGSGKIGAKHEGRYIGSYATVEEARAAQAAVASRRPRRSEVTTQEELHV